MISSAQIFRWKNWLKIFFQFQIQRKIFSTKEVLHISGVLKLVNEQKQSYWHSCSCILQMRKHRAKKFKMTYILNFSAEIPHSKLDSQIRGIYKKPTPAYIINTEFSNEISS